jgi:hypothetical protein
VRHSLTVTYAHKSRVRLADHFFGAIDGSSGRQIVFSRGTAAITSSPTLVC